MSTIGILKLVFGIMLGSFGEHFGVILGSFWEPFGPPGAMLRHNSKKLTFGTPLGGLLEPTGAKMGALLGAKMVNLAPKMANLAPFWEPSWLVQGILERILSKTVKKQKTLKKNKKTNCF